MPTKRSTRQSRQSKPPKAALTEMIAMLTELRDRPEAFGASRPKYEAAANDMHRVLRGAQLAGGPGREAQWVHVAGVVEIAARALWSNPNAPDVTGEFRSTTSKKDRLYHARLLISDLAERVDPAFRRLNRATVADYLSKWVPSHERKAFTTARIAAEIAIDTEACGVSIKNSDGGREGAVTRVRHAIENAVAKRR